LTSSKTAHDRRIVFSLCSNAPVTREAPRGIDAAPFSACAMIHMCGTLFISSSQLRHTCVLKRRNVVFFLKEAARCLVCLVPVRSKNPPAFTYVVPIGYAYDGESINGHSTDGLQLRMMRERPEVCFSIGASDGIERWRSAHRVGVRGVDRPRCYARLADADGTLHPAHGARCESTGAHAAAPAESRGGRFD
jgi:hypothetical protein